MDASTSSRLQNNVNNQYKESLSPDKTYMFVLELSSDRLDRLPETAIVISKPSRDNKTRVNNVVGPQMQKTVSVSQKPQMLTSTAPPSCGDFRVYLEQLTKIDYIPQFPFAIRQDTPLSAPFEVTWWVKDYYTWIAVPPLPPIPYTNDPQCSSPGSYYPTTYTCYSYVYLRTVRTYYIPCATQLTSITIDPASATAYLHPSPVTVPFAATGNYSDSTTQPLTSTAMWNSSDPTVATVNAGVATPQKPGYCQITTTQNGVTSDPAALEVQCRQYTAQSQRDLGWGSNYYDHLYPPYATKTETIDSAGCALTSMSMILGQKIMLMRPDILNNWMNLFGYYSQPPKRRGLVFWFSIADYPSSNIQLAKAVPENKDKNTGQLIPYAIANLDQYLSNCMPLIAEVRQPNSRNLHWVLVTDKIGNDYRVIDPYPIGTEPLGQGQSRTLSYFNSTIYSYIVYKLL